MGTYDLLSFTRLNGQTSRRGLPVHFPRYQLQREEDCTEFQAALLALLKKVPLHTDAETLVVKHWLYFYERCIGCVGVLKDWLLRAVSAALDEGDDTLTLERVQEHALSISQCEQMALDAVEGEQKLNYTEGRREHLWRLLQGEGILVPAPRLPARDAGTPQPLSANQMSFYTGGWSGTNSTEPSQRSSGRMSRMWVSTHHSHDSTWSGLSLPHATGDTHHKGWFTMGEAGNDVGTLRPKNVTWTRMK